MILAPVGLELPKDSRTFLKTPRSVDVTFNNDNGKKSSYCYLGIFNSLQDVFDLPPPCSIINLIVNIDGLPLFKSANSQLWPILGSVFQSDLVFPIALFYGNSKPDCLNDFLSDFINEVKQLMEEGIDIKGKKYGFCLKTLVCDAPARS